MSFYTRAAVLAAVLVSSVLLSIDRGVDAANPEPQSARVTALRDFLASQGSPAFVDDEREAELWRTVQTFYWNRGYAPAWIRDDALTPGGEALVRLIAAAGREGLPSERYDPRFLVGQAPHVVAVAADAAVDDRYAKLDVALSYALLLLRRRRRDGNGGPQRRRPSSGGRSGARSTPWPCSTRR